MLSLIYCFSVPITFITSFSYAICVPTFVMALVYFGINHVGTELSDPFGQDTNDIALEAFQRQLDEDLGTYMMQWMVQPPLPPPKVALPTPAASPSDPVARVRTKVRKPCSPGHGSPLKSSAGKIPRSASPGHAARVSRAAAASSAASTAASKPPGVMVPGDRSSNDSTFRTEPPRSLDSAAPDPRDIPFDPAPSRGISPSPVDRAASSGAGLKQRHSSLQMLQRSYTATTTFAVGRGPSPSLGGYAQVGSDAPENPLEV